MTAVAKAPEPTPPKTAVAEAPEPPLVGVKTMVGAEV